MYPQQEGRCKATWEREFGVSWREAGPSYHLDDLVDSDHDDIVDLVDSEKGGVVVVPSALHMQSAS